MRPHHLLDSVLVLVIGCKDSDRASDRTRTRPLSQPAVATDASATIDCDSIVTRDLRSQHLHDMTVTAASPTLAMRALCQLEGAGVDQRGQIEAACDRAGDLASTEVARIKSANPRARDVAVGQTAVLVDRGDRQQLSAWDDDSSCRIRMTLPPHVDAVQVGRAVLERLPPRG